MVRFRQNVRESDITKWRKGVLNPARVSPVPPDRSHRAARERATAVAFLTLGSSGTGRPTRIGRCAHRLLCLLALITCLGSAAGDTLIAHPGVDVQSLSQNEARLYFGMRLNQWPNGQGVKVFVLPDNHPLHERVVKSILGLYPYQLRRAWDRQLFSGTGQAPVVVATEAELMDRVAKTPGALGYAAAGSLNPSVRALEVR